jgi:uncharacterized phiE125 gp8 family phage protein
MSLVVITQPAAPVVDLEEVKAHLRVDHGDDDDEIKALIQAAITEFEDPNLGWLGRSISERELELRVDAFPRGHNLCCGILLRNGPLLMGVVGADTYDFTVTYDDPSGAAQVLAETVYRVVDAESGQPLLVLKRGQVWPATACELQAVRIRYWAGYPADDPRLAPFKAAVKLHVEMIYDGDVDRQDKLRATINALLQPYRVYTF